MKQVMGKVPKKLEVRAENALLQEALRAFGEATGAAAEVMEMEPKLAGGRADAVLEVRKGKNKVRYPVEIKHAVPVGALGHVVAQLQRFKKPCMLITRYITHPMAERLKELDMAFMDTAGNAYINAPQLFIHVTGRKLPETDKEAKKVRAFRPTGLQVVFALLCLPELIKAPYRDIAKAANVALGTVGWAMYDLRRLNYLVERGKLGRKFVNTHKLLDTWVTAYAQQLRPKLYIGRFRGPNTTWWEDVDWRRFDTHLGGEPAAARLTGYLKPGTATIYAAGDVNQFLIMNRLKKDATGDVDIIKTFWHFDYPWDYRELTPPLLVYADLLATANDRNIETGKIIYDKHLARLIG